MTVFTGYTVFTPLVDDVRSRIPEGWQRGPLRRGAIAETVSSVTEVRILYPPLEEVLSETTVQ